jgi:hypothetical protein
VAVKVITPHIQAMDLTTAPGPIMAEAQSWSRLGTDRTIAVPDIGLAVCTMSGGLVTGRRGMVSECGSVGITSREDTRPLLQARRRTVSGLPSRDQSAQQTEKSPDERFKKIMAP